MNGRGEKREKREQRSAQNNNWGKEKDTRIVTKRVGPSAMTPATLPLEETGQARGKVSEKTMGLEIGKVGGEKII